MKKPDGGPAFPIAQPNVPPDQWYIGPLPTPGMSLRDYFAGQALAGICGDGIPGGHHRPEETARDAYAYADAMLVARDKDAK